MVWVLILHLSFLLLFKWPLCSELTLLHIRTFGVAGVRFLQARCPYCRHDGSDKPSQRFVITKDLHCKKITRGKRMKLLLPITNAYPQIPTPTFRDSRPL